MFERLTRRGLFCRVAVYLLRRRKKKPALLIGKKGGVDLPRKKGKAQVPPPRSEIEKEIFFEVRRQRQS